MSTNMHYTNFREQSANQKSYKMLHVVADQTPAVHCQGFMDLISISPRINPKKTLRQFFIKQNDAVQRLPSANTVHRATHNLMLPHLLSVNTPIQLLPEIQPPFKKSKLVNSKCILHAIEQATIFTHKYLVNIKHQVMFRG